MTNLGAVIGLCRSLVIYYGRPWRVFSARRFYKEFIRPGDLVFDIGAHVGSRTQIFRALGARVVAVEPQPLFYRFLKSREGRGVTVLNRAVGGAPGIAELHISSRHPTVTTLSTEWISEVRADTTFGNVRWNSSASVEITTLDALIAEHGLPQFCKIDVEGSEAEVLRGLSQPVPSLSFEYIPAAIDRALTCVDLVATLGDYKFNRVVGEGYRFTHHEWRSAPAIRAELESLRTGHASGDIYARTEGASR